VDQGHIEVADIRAVQGPIEQRILPVEECQFEGALAEIMPTPGLCRVTGFPSRPACFLKVADAA
jgi:hypothetical protein